MRTTQPRCPYCLDDLGPDDVAVRCARCRTPHHGACFEEHGGCCSFGCLGRVEVPAGASIFLRESLRTLVPSGSAPFGPFELTWRRLDHVPERRAPSRCPPAHARLSLEGRELREGASLRGRAAIYLPERARFRRIELVLTQGLRRPDEVARVALVVARRAGALEGEDLPMGSHPFSLELRAPDVTGPVDPFSLELVLSRGLFQSDIGSHGWPLFLLERVAAPAQDAHAVIIPRAAVEPAAPLAVFAAPARGDGWTLVQADGLEVAARAALGAEGPLALTAAPIEDGAEIALRIDGAPRPLRALALAVRWELVRPGGGEVVAPGFPARADVRLLGAGGLDPAGLAGAGLEAVLRIPAARLGALAQARCDGAHNAGLRIGLSLEVEHPDGRREAGPSRTVMISRVPAAPLAPPAGPAPRVAPAAEGGSDRTLAAPLT